MRRLPLLAAAAVVLVACASATDREGHEALGKTSSPVINGEVDTPPRYDSTILIQTVLSGGYGAGCTGTLISPHVVITARHCVSNYNESSRTFGADYDPKNMYIWYGTEPRGSEDNLVARIVHPGGSYIDNNDFALLVLKNAATKIPFAQIRLAKPPVKGEKVAVAGYGLTTTDTGTPTSLHKRYRRENLAIAAVGPVESYGIGAKEIVLGESICQGDSGGPVYAQGSVALLAVTSRGGNGKAPTATQPWLGCVGSSTYNLFTRVDGFKDLIVKTVTDVGEKVWEEGEPKPEPPAVPVPDPGALGAVCANGEECASKLCVEWNGSNVCSEACSDLLPCPTGFFCNGGYCLAGEPPPPDPGTTPAAGAAPGTTSSGSCAVSGARASDAAEGSLGFLAVALGLAATRARRSVRRRRAAQ
ncbi:MAG: trypsin-like serine protease [Deltaproteobacteria bacterium]|nr:trypsin-like serine protease [Deltaproteobacteria bacterium]